MNQQLFTDAMKLIESRALDSNQVWIADIDDYDMRADLSVICKGKNQYGAFLLYGNDFDAQVRNDPNYRGQHSLFGNTRDWFQTIFRTVDHDMHRNANPWYMGELGKLPLDPTYTGDAQVDEVARRMVVASGLKEFNPRVIE